MAHVAIVKRDRHKVDLYRGQKLFYVLANYGGVVPYLRLFRDRASRDYYVGRGSRWGGRLLGIGSVIYH